MSSPDPQQDSSNDISMDMNNTNNNGMTLSQLNTKDDDEQCICGDPLTHKYDCSLYCGQSPCAEKLVKLPKCSHRIHESCLKKLLFTRLSSCPLCRSSINIWRTHAHYQTIEKEITTQFDRDTQEAIRLSLELQKESVSNRSEQKNTRNDGSNANIEVSDNMGNYQRRRHSMRNDRTHDNGGNQRRHSSRLRSRSRSRSRESRRRRNST